jgi:hypothetical protein
MTRFKPLLCLLLFALSPSALHAQRSITVTMHKFDCYDPNLKEHYKKDATEAYRIMSELLSSPEFRDSLSKLSFPTNTFCSGCGPDFPKGDKTVSGARILDILFARKTDFMNLYMDKHSGASGATVPCDSLTTAYYENLDDDMCHLPPAVRLAVNLCHEYFHHIGFCHTHNPKDKTLRKMVTGDDCRTEYYDPKFYKNDVAYRVGWIAYDILTKRYDKPAVAVKKRN